MKPLQIMFAVLFVLKKRIHVKCVTYILAKGPNMPLSLFMIKNLIMNIFLRKSIYDISNFIH